MNSREPYDAENLPKLVQNHTKPSLVVKTTGGRKYLQIRTLAGGLIHLGPSRDIENWAIGIKALREQYMGYALLEALSLDYEKASEALMCYTGNMDQVKEEWDRYREKWVKSRIKHVLPGLLFRGLEEEELYREIVQIRTKLENDIKASNIFQEPPEYTQLLIELELAEKQGKQETP